jgi:hypothetical protein
MSTRKEKPTKKPMDNKERKKKEKEETIKNPDRKFPK